MKQAARAQLAQSINLTPQLLQSIRLLQLTSPQLEQELLQALALNPMLEQDESDEAGETDIDAGECQSDDAALEAAAWDELPEPMHGSTNPPGGSGADDDGIARIADGSSSDPRVRLLQELALEWDPDALPLAQWWLDHCDDRGYLEQPVRELIAQGARALAVAKAEMRLSRLRLLHGPWPGMAAADASECLRAQLRAQRSHLRATDTDEVATFQLAERILDGHIALLAANEVGALAKTVRADVATVERAIGLIRALSPSAVEEPADDTGGYIIPDVVVRFIGGDWRVALNGRAAPRVRVAAHCERALADAPGDQSVLRGLLDEARWLVRGVAMRNETLLRTAQVLVERQRGFLERGEEAIAPLTLREVADTIAMHESTVSRITTGKYIQTPRGTFELKRLFAVRLEGAAVSGAAVKAMVKRLIDAEPPHAPLADDTIAGLLERRGVRIARRTVAKYRDQLSIGPARSRQRPAPTPFAG
ncbi:RNA polymerase factor sigma-54 [Lysobacter ciconiae]|uniref:RNA polymerase sigma-54 factor n=1 Tax=Novilysobacter ciconiae TaxID=2781022 RepID=A0A7S6ZSR9_9GAMM|nr:RNA polymerase factor sigma-54 [Lysobacter ciconiae]QOW20120.1 RNA polymerase factor sigma-54 [Lysobacter ciconiae]